MSEKKPVPPAAPLRKKCTFGSEVDGIGDEPVKSVVLVVYGSNNGITSPTWTMKKVHEMVEILLAPHILYGTPASKIDLTVRVRNTSRLNKWIISYCEQMKHSYEIYLPNTRDFWLTNSHTERLRVRKERDSLMTEGMDGLLILKKTSLTYINFFLSRAAEQETIVRICNYV